MFNLHMCKGAVGAYLLLMESSFKLKLKVVYYLLGWKEESASHGEYYSSDCKWEKKMENQRKQRAVIGNKSSRKEELPDFLGLAYHSFILDTFGNFLFLPGRFCPNVATSGIKHGLASLLCGSSYFY